METLSQDTTGVKPTKYSQHNSYKLRYLEQGLCEQGCGRRHRPGSRRCDECSALNAKRQRVYLEKKKNLPADSHKQEAPISESGKFNPKAPVTDKTKKMQNVTSRPGRDKFERNLKHSDAYGDRCAATGSFYALQCCHIDAYINAELSDFVVNGIVLRSDIHWLWDHGFIQISQNYTIWLCRELQNDRNYIHLHGKQLCLPSNMNYWPDKEALRKHDDQSGWKGMH